MIVVFAAAALTMAVLESVSVQTPPAAANLVGTSWQLVKFQGGDDTTLTPDDRSKYTIEFGANGTLIARIDCNRGRGTWKASGSSLDLGPLALTRAMCPPGSLHDRIVKQWGTIRSYVLRDGHLFLSLMADGGIYEFEPVAGAKPPAAAAGRPLEKTYWKATVIGTSAVAATDPKREPHLVLEGGKVAGSDGCNRLVGTYDLTTETIKFGRMAGTMMACPGTGETERAFRQALENARRWKIAGDGLELHDAAGARLARFEGRDKQ